MSQNDGPYQNDEVLMPMSASAYLTPLFVAIPASVLGVVYSCLGFVIENLYFSALLPLIWGTMVGSLGKKFLRISRVRSLPLGIFLLFLGALVGYLVSWYTWLSIYILVYDEGMPQTFAAFYINSEKIATYIMYLVQQPQNAFSVVNEVYANGFWKLEGTLLKEKLLLLVWVVEAIFYFIPALGGRKISAVSV